MTRAKVSICVLVALTLAWLGSSPAAGNEPRQGEIRLTAVTPSLLDPADDDAEVRVAGTFTNTTGSSLTWVTAELWHYPGQLSDFAAVDVALRTPANGAIGIRHEPGAPLAQDEPIAPGQTVEFELRVPTEALRATSSEVATLLGVHIRGISQGTEQRVTLGRTRVLVPHAAQPFDIVDPAIITHRPGQLPGSRTISDDLSEAVRGPHLIALLGAVEEERKVLLDLDVYRAAATLADEGEPVAQQFVLAVQQAYDGDLLWWLPPGNPNLERMPEELRAEVPGWAREALPKGLEDAPLVGLLADPRNTPEGFDHVLTYGTGQDSTYLFRLGGADTMIVDELEPTMSTAPLATATEPWSDVESTVETFRGRAAIRKDLTASSTDPEAADRQSHNLVLQAYSTSFDDESAALEHLHSSPLVTFDPADISMSVANSFVMGARTNEFPTTISNQSSLDVQVQIRMRSENPQRITVPDTDVVTIGAGESQTLLLSPQATANGITTIHAQLASPAGVPLGLSQAVEVTSTEFSRVGWILIIVSGVVVLGGTVWRIRTVRHERTKEAGEPGQ